VLAPVEIIDDPWAYVACLVIGAVLTAAALWKRPPVQVRAALLILGQTIILTAPLAVHIEDYWYGAFPTVDKEGSLLFYLDGVHRRMLLHPLATLTDPAVRLIGVHTGHLWVTELFDLFLSPMGAFNIQGLLYPALAWFAAWLLLRDVCGDDRVSFVLSFAWGTGLHMFRDLDWYTIEKAAIFWLALFAWALHRAWQRGGRWPWITAALFALMSWMNLYLGLVGGALGALALLAVAWPAFRQRAWTPQLLQVAQACAASLVLAAPLLLWQGAVMRSGPGLGSPEQFLWQRAALDGFSLVPLRWNRLEIHRALNVVALGLALFGVFGSWRDGRVRFATGAALVLWVLSIGPVLLPGPVENPVYMAARAVVPGFWRVARPEVFFHASWLLLLCIAAIQLVRAAPRRGGLGLLYALFLLAWMVSVRSHPAYPDMTMPLDSQLDPAWQQRVFKAR